MKFFSWLKRHQEQIKESRELLTCGDEEEEHNDPSIAKVEKGVDKATHLQLGEEEMDTVEEEIDGGEARCQEGSPPPVIVLKSKKQTKQLDNSENAYEDYFIRYLRLRDLDYHVLCLSASYLGILLKT